MNLGLRAGVLASVGLLMTAAAGLRPGEPALNSTAVSIPDQARPVVLLRGRIAGGCTAETAEKVLWPDQANALLQAAGGPQSPSACADERALFFRDGAAAGYRWTRQGFPLSAQEPNPLRPVHLTVWVVGSWDCGGPTSPCPWTRSVVHAQRSFRDWRVGLALDTNVKRVTDERSINQVGKGCATVGTLLESSALYDRGRLNVYWLPSSAGPVWGALCSEDFAPDIIFIFGASQPAILAHELGHALGLQVPMRQEKCLPGKWGHTNCFQGFGECVPGFEEGNLMWDGSWVVKHVSLGQAFRMNFDTRSWLNRPGAPPEPFARTCQSDPRVPTYACPTLALSFPEGVP